MNELLYISTTSIVTTSEYCGYSNGRALGWQRCEKMEDMHVVGPTMVEVYYSICFDKQRVPTQEEFATKYEELNSGWFDEHSSDNKDAMRLRVWRAWPSLVAEHHLFSLFVESGLCQSAYKALEGDIVSGSDMIVRDFKLRGPVHIASFIDTPDGWRKAGRKTRRPPAPRLYLPLNRDGSPLPLKVGRRSKAGLFHLYTDAHVEMAVEAFGVMVDKRWHEATCLRYAVGEGLTDGAGSDVVQLGRSSTQLKLFKL